MASYDGDFDDASLDNAELDIQPFQFEPMPRTGRGREADTTDDDDEEDEVPDYNLERIGNTEW